MNYLVKFLLLIGKRSLIYWGSMTLTTLYIFWPCLEEQLDRMTKCLALTLHVLSLYIQLLV